MKKIIVLLVSILSIILAIYFIQTVSSIKVSKELKIKTFNSKNTYLSYTMPRGHPFFLLLVVRNDDTFKGKIVIQSESKNIFETSISDVISTQYKSSKPIYKDSNIAYILVPGKISYELFKANEKYTFNISLEKKPISEVSLWVDWLE